MELYMVVRNMAFFAGCMFITVPVLAMETYLQGIKQENDKIYQELIAKSSWQANILNEYRQHLEQFEQQSISTQNQLFEEFKAVASNDETASLDACIILADTQFPNITETKYKKLYAWKAFPVIKKIITSPPQLHEFVLKRLHKDPSSHISTLPEKIIDKITSFVLTDKDIIIFFGLPFKNDPFKKQITKREIDFLTEKMKHLWTQRDEIFDDASESGAIFMTLFKYTTKEHVKSELSSPEFEKVLHRWKAVPITRQIARIGKRLNELNGIENSTDREEPTQNLVKTLTGLRTDPDSFIGRLPQDLFHRIKEDLVENSEAVCACFRIFSQRTGKELGDYVNQINQYEHLQQNRIFW